MVNVVKSFLCVGSNDYIFTLQFVNIYNIDLENSAVATGLEKVSFHSNPKEKQSQRMLKQPHNLHSPHTLIK